jgi:hypothetical protein
MDRGCEMEGLKYQATDVASITSENDVAVNSKVVIRRPWRHLWITLTKNQNAWKIVIRLGGSEICLRLGN